MPIRSTREDPEAEGREIAAAPPRLDSLADYGEVPLRVLDAVAPRRIVEVGGGHGAFTRVLVDWARPRGAAVACVEPEPAPALAALSAEGVRLVRERSPGALAGEGPFDLYVLDGDPNYAVVSAELSLVAPEACVLVHHVGWPLGRRDGYHEPAALDAAIVRPHAEAGAAIGASLRDSAGLAGERPLALATEPGGERNGVLTAVEDHVATRGDLLLRIVPCLHGLAILFPGDAPYAAVLDAVIAPYVDSPLLARLEANRLALLAALAERR